MRVRSTCDCTGLHTIRKAADANLTGRVDREPPCLRAIDLLCERGENAVTTMKAMCICLPREAAEAKVQLERHPAQGKVVLQMG